ncbi:MAG: hypothetical protein ACD_87C00220G0002 [uncultured bacterium]|nr:MAG: hypothetical protein ACD_87C00220G0002 [uncultured bacterium]
MNDSVTERAGHVMLPMEERGRRQKRYTHKDPLTGIYDIVAFHRMAGADLSK